jgi:hypothetical protein
MRYILSLALLLAACTRANPDLVNGNGGGGAGSGGAGAAGGGGGGAGGGGGGTVGTDLAMSTADDMAHGADMSSHDGVACGATSCMGDEDCCVGSNGQEQCTNKNQCSGGSHPTLWACDGPEDCPGAVPGTQAECCANLSGSACDPSCTLVSNSAPMCHSLSDCPAGYTSCCVIKPLPQYSVCSKQACPP